MESMVKRATENVESSPNTAVISKKKNSEDKNIISTRGEEKRGSTEVGIWNTNMK